MRALITGAGGFVGQWLCKELLSDGWDVHGATLTGAPASGTLEDWQRDAVLWHDVDLRDPADVATALDAARPDAVFHLAAVSFVPAAGKDPSEAWSTNVLAAVHLLDAIAERRRAGTGDPVVVIAGSGEQYGAHATSEMPLVEESEQRPCSVYGATKVAQEAAALASWRATGTRVIAARAFNHSGPGQAPAFLLPSLVARVMDAQERNERVIHIGNPTPVRDFLHVQDVARAYLLLALRGEPGQAYNISSGEGVSVTQLAELVLAEAGYEARVESDPALMRAVEVPVLIGNPAKLMRATTWTIQHTLDTLIGDMLDAAAN